MTATTTKMVKFLTVADLDAAKPNDWRTLGNAAQVTKLRQTLDPALRYPIVFTLYHDQRNASSVRASVGLPSGSTFQLDLPPKLYNSLGAVEIDE